MRTWNFLHFLFFSIVQTGANFSCEIIFRTFGDSHAHIPTIEALKNIPNHLKQYFRAYSYSTPAKLMFSIARDGINITELLRKPQKVILRPWRKDIREQIKFNLTIPSVIWPYPDLSAPNISEKDILYFIFGEIDARHKIGNVVQRGILPIENLESSINDMVDRYIVRIKNAVEQIPAKTVWIGGLFPQPLFNERTHITGSWEQRQLCANLINQRLKMNSLKEGYLFMDFSKGYSNSEGDLDMTMTDGLHHLNLWTEKTKDEFAAKFVEHFERVCGQIS